MVNWLKEFEPPQEPQARIQTQWDLQTNFFEVSSQRFKKLWTEVAWVVWWWAKKQTQWDWESTAIQNTSSNQISTQLEQREKKTSESKRHPIIQED